MVAPYYPPVLSTPIVNPKVGGFVRPFPYLSLSQYRYAPTAMDTQSLVTSNIANPTEQDQEQALFNVINRMSGWIDRHCFGSDPAIKGASLCASQVVEDLWVLPLKNQLNLQCSFKPILQLDGLALGSDPSQVQSITQQMAVQCRFGIRTIYVPMVFPGLMTMGNALNFDTAGPDGKTYCVWTYTAGYPHLQLAANAAQGANSISVLPNGPSGTLLGVYPGTAFSIEDQSNSEPFTVSSVSGTTLNLDAPLTYAHTVPAAPDFIPVTALPEDVIQAAIFLTTALIKTRGDWALELQGINEPKDVTSKADATESDVKYACWLLEPFKVRSKQRS